MYTWRLGDRISFNHGGYGWHGIVTEIHDKDGHFHYMVLLDRSCRQAYKWYMEVSNAEEILVREQDCYL